MWTDDGYDKEEWIRNKKANIAMMKQYEIDKANGTLPKPTKLQIAIIAVAIPVMIVGGADWLYSHIKWNYKDKYRNYKD